LRAAQDRTNTLKTAPAEVEQQLEALERTKAEFADGKVRAETAAEIELLARKLTEAANSQALSTRQSIAVSALALANQSQASVLQLLR
jgi:hypothetical protein